MKKVLSLLMSFVFLNATVWAFPPDYSGSGTVQNLVGVYAGVLIPTSNATQINNTAASSNSTATNTSTGNASLGIFAIGIPGTTAATPISQGAGVLFSSGAGYNLMITGVFDPQDSTLSAVIEGQSNFTVTQVVDEDGTLTTITFNVQAEGSLTGTISQTNNHAAVTGPGTANAARIIGTAFIDTFTSVNVNGPQITGTIDFTLNGFQQSSTYSVPTLTITPGTGT